MSDIIHLARRASEARLLYEILGQTNASGVTPEERVAADARYRLVRDAWLSAEHAYQSALSTMSCDELRKVADGI